MNGIAMLLNPILNLADGLRPVLVVVGTEIEKVIEGGENYLPIAIDTITDAIEESPAARNLIISQLSHFYAQQEWMKHSVDSVSYDECLTEARRDLEKIFNQPSILKIVIQHVFSSCKTAAKALGDLDPRSPAELSMALAMLINCFRAEAAKAAA